MKSVERILRARPLELRGWMAATVAHLVVEALMVLR
jgi:hypothetical protein